MHQYIINTIIIQNKYSICKFTLKINYWFLFSSQSLKNMKSCSICKEQYNDTTRLPKILPCGHTFCQPCISHQCEQGLFICPKDKKVHSIQSCDLSTNFSILELLRSTLATRDLLCCNGHPLYTHQSYTPKKCSICKLDTPQYQECRLCLYQVCPQCRAWMQSDTFPDQGLICYRGHQLRNTENVEKFYEAIRGAKKTRGKFLCDGCLEKKTGGSAQCRQCKVDYCNDCLKKYSRISERIEGLGCNKKKYDGVMAFVTGSSETCSARLAWRPDTVEFKCEGCRKYFNKSGAFLCRECDVGFCINCAYGKVA